MPVTVSLGTIPRNSGTVARARTAGGLTLRAAASFLRLTGPHGGQMAQVLGIDIGGTGIKGAPVDVATGQLTKERKKLDKPRPA